jgi:hypothetical protein
LRRVKMATPIGPLLILDTWKPQQDLLNKYLSSTLKK